MVSKKVKGTVKPELKKELKNQNLKVTLTSKFKRNLDIDFLKKL